MQFLFFLKLKLKPGVHQISMDPKAQIDCIIWTIYAEKLKHARTLLCLPGSQKKKFL